MKDRIKLNQGESLQRESTRTKGPMAEMDITNYSILNQQGDRVGSVIYTDHTALKGFRRTQTVLQKDIDGNVLIDVTW